MTDYYGLGEAVTQLLPKNVYTFTKDGLDTHEGQAVQDAEGRA